MEEKGLKVGMIGLGPIGQVLAVHLIEAGCHIAVTDLDKEKLALMRRTGIELVEKINKQAFLKYVYNSIEELLEHDLDIVVCAVKAYHIDKILGPISQRAGKNVCLLSVHNGIDVIGKYLEQFESSRLFTMVVNYAGTLQAPNVTAVNFLNPPSYIASIDDSHPEIANWFANKLSGVNMETIPLNAFDIKSKIWEKAILNTALSPLCAISKLTMKEAMELPNTIEIVQLLISEAMEVAKAENIRLPDNFMGFCLRYLKNAGNHMPSLAVDLMNKQETEIDYMNGKIVEYGQKHNIKTTLNLAFTTIVKAISYRANKNQKPLSSFL